MAVTNFEELNTSTDVTTTKTLLYESIPLTGTVVSGTYSDLNIKNYTHGQFQSVYDYPYLSSSANHIFDIALGYDEASPLSGSSAVQNAKKINMYNQMSQVLLGYTGSTNKVRKFESDLLLDGVNPMKEVLFMNFSRLITKDQIKKGTFSVTLGTGSWANPFGAKVVLTDSVATDVQGTTNTLGGDYGVLFESTATSTVPHGLVFYQAGIVVLSASVFNNPIDFLRDNADIYTVAAALTGSAITGSANALRHRVQNISFNNTTEINSSIYFCRVPHNKYNHSSNPTYLSSSTIRVKSVNSDQPISYITTIGLYSSDNELLAVAKLSEPLRKDPTNELTLRVRLDY
jgi:hypothetical protein